jgi:GntR family transcriptional repressor for pyruvate dehydrogenase complex
LTDKGTFTRLARRYQQRKGARPEAPERLYETVARRLVDDIRAGTYQLGDRLPGERDLSTSMSVGRAAVREALLALEVFGVIEVRLGSGAYVIWVPDGPGDPGYTISALELMEARVLIEGEAAALAATRISEEELAGLDRFIAMIAEGSYHGSECEGEGPDEAFHRLIGRATRNKALHSAIDNLWDLRSTAPECALLLVNARTNHVEPVVEEHRAIVAALRAGDAVAAREAMHAHLAQVMDYLHDALEEQRIAELRAEMDASRRHFAPPARKANPVA